jgi:hypothetical protein
MNSPAASAPGPAGGAEPFDPAEAAADCPTRTGGAAATGGSASSTVSSTHNFHGWNQYNPNPTATAPATNSPDTHGLANTRNTST